MRRRGEGVGIRGKMVERKDKNIYIKNLGW